MKPSAGTFDPTYLVYSLGKLMMLKLRRDYKEQQGGKYSLRIVPRRGALAGERAVLGASPRCCSATTVGRRHWSRNREMPLYEYQCERAAVASKSFGSSPIPTLRGVHAVRQGTGAAAACRRRRFSSRDRAGTSPTTRRKGRAGSE